MHWRILSLIDRALGYLEEMPHHAPRSVEALRHLQRGLRSGKALEVPERPAGDIMLEKWLQRYVRTLQELHALSQEAGELTAGLPGKPASSRPPGTGTSTNLRL
ncbi:MAG: hypothetical protein IMX02_01535 [Limnochordaceae bacterium]|nr:hypothetical protein [Limnochordaceae bacterium]